MKQQFFYIYNNVLDYVYSLCDHCISRRPNAPSENYNSSDNACNDVVLLVSCHCLFVVAATLLHTSIGS